MSYLQVLKKESKVHLETIRDDLEARKNKDFFRPIGTQVYIGEQGSGKTASAVYHVQKLRDRYPRALVVSNLHFTKLRALTFSSKAELQNHLVHIDPRKQYIRFDDMDQLALVLTGVNNGKFGVIYLIDEIHSYLNAKDSKNIPMYVFSEISQQRKQRKVIIGTSQLFMRAAIALREQCQWVIACNTYFGVWTVQKAYKGSDVELFYSSKATQGQKTISPKRVGWFMQSRQLRESYDTFQKISSGLDVLDLETPISLTIMQKRSRFGR